MESKYVPVFHQGRRPCYVVLKLGTHSILRAGLDCGKEVHQSTILEEWSNMIGYEMGSSPARVYNTTKTSPMKKFKHGCQHDNALCEGNCCGGQVSWSTSNTWTRNLDIEELQLDAFRINK